MAKIILEDDNGCYVVEPKIQNGIVTIQEYYDYLIRPVLLAAGFNCVDDFFGMNEGG